MSAAFKNVLNNNFYLINLYAFSHYGSNHPLGMLGNIMSVSNLQNLQNIPNLQHNDVLEKLKMQVREMKVGFMVN